MRVVGIIGCQDCCVVRNLYFQAWLHTCCGTVINPTCRFMNIQTFSFFFGCVSVFVITNVILWNESCKPPFLQTCSVRVDSTAPSAVDNSANKRIMLVSDFYYGQFEGDGNKVVQKTNTTFKCQSCLKVLKNNIRYDGFVFTFTEVMMVLSFIYSVIKMQKRHSAQFSSHPKGFVCYNVWLRVP